MASFRRLDKCILSTGPFSFLSGPAFSVPPVSTLSRWFWWLIKVSRVISVTAGLQRTTFGFSVFKKWVLKHFFFLSCVDQQRNTWKSGETFTVHFYTIRVKFEKKKKKRKNSPFSLLSVFRVVSFSAVSFSLLKRLYSSVSRPCYGDTRVL